jgi:hypothetical protein
VKLRWGVSAVSHGEGLGTFYRAGVVGGKPSKEVARRSVAVRVIGWRTIVTGRGSGGGGGWSLFSKLKGRWCQLHLLVVQ